MTYLHAQLLCIEERTGNEICHEPLNLRRAARASWPAFPHAELNRNIAERAQPVNGCSDWHRAST
jgi:hypothetical protein